MSGNHLFDLIRKHMPANPAQARFCELPDGRNYTYSDVLDVSGRFANVLVSLGVKPGDRVAVQVPKSIEALMLYLGAVRAGAVFLPLNTAYTRNEIAYFLKDAEPTVFVADPKRADEMRDVAAECAVPQFETLGVWRKPEANETDADTGGTLAAAGLAAQANFTDVPRTKDDQPYRTVGEVGLVSGLEGGALAQVATWALDRGWDDALDAWLGVYDGVGFSLLDGEATLVVANGATWETLDEAAGLRADAVDSIVRARPILSIDQLAGLPRVGPSNLDALRRYARMAQPVAAEPLAD